MPARGCRKRPPRGEATSLCRRDNYHDRHSSRCREASQPSRRPTTRGLDSFNHAKATSLRLAGILSDASIATSPGTGSVSAARSPAQPLTNRRRRPHRASTQRLRCTPHHHRYRRQPPPSSPAPRGGTHGEWGSAHTPCGGDSLRPHTRPEETVFVPNSFDLEHVARD